jgi:hypothetical protein
MPPIDLLEILVGLTIVAMAVDRWFRLREQTLYRQLATEHRMHYSPGDPLRLTPRVAAHLSIPGAAGVRVIDLLYRTDEQNHYYIFTAEYTLGAAGPKHRLRRGASFIESKSVSPIQTAVQLGDADLPLIQQYQSLIARVAVFKDS